MEDTPQRRGSYLKHVIKFKLAMRAGVLGKLLGTSALRAVAIQAR